MTIYIFDGDADTTRSHKYLLETQRHKVEIIEEPEAPIVSSINTQDILMLDIGTQSAWHFNLLDFLINAEWRPKLLLTAFEDQIFNYGDQLRGGAFQILFKPFTPTELFEAINDLRLLSHG